MLTISGLWDAPELSGAFLLSTTSDLGGNIMQDHIVASYAPDEAFSRHSEGAFLRLKDNRILFVYSRFTGTSDDDAPSNLVSVYSADEGETWTEPVVTIDAAMYNTKNVMSVSLLRMENGDVGLFYIVKQTPGVNRIMLARSRDEGQTYYRHVECSQPDRAGYYVLNNDRVIHLHTGRLLVPLTFHRGSYAAGGREGYLDGRSIGCFLYSDDDGETWREGTDTIYPPFTGSRTGLQEGGVIEKKNGVVWAYYRTDRMYQYESFSLDGGMHWTVPQASRFTSPASPLKIARHPETGDLYAVWNPIPNYNGRAISRAGWGRTPIVWAASHDDGLTWSDYHVIEDAEDHGYCYPAVFFTDDHAMLVGYCSGGPDDNMCCLAKLSIKKIAL